MTEQDSSSSNELSSLSPSSADAHVYKAIIAIGVVGTEDDVARFTALWIADSEKRAHQIANTFGGLVRVLPLPEDDAQV